MGTKPSSRRYRNRPKAYIDWTHYDPHPPNVMKVELSGFVEDVLPQVAEKTHNAWMDDYRKQLGVKQRFELLTPGEAREAMRTEPRYNAWYNLPQDMRDRYVGEARLYLQAMQYMGYELEEIYPGDVVDPEDQGMLSVEAAEAAAKLLHAAWCRSQLDKGYVYGPSFNDDPRDGPLTNPDIVQYEYLGGFDPNETDYAKIKDMEWSRDLRQSIRFKPIMNTLNYALGSGNFQIIRSETDYEQARRGPRDSSDLDRALRNLDVPYPEFDAGPAFDE